MQRVLELFISDCPRSLPYAGSLQPSSLAAHRVCLVEVVTRNLPSGFVDTRDVLGKSMAPAERGGGVYVPLLWLSDRLVRGSVAFAVRRIKAYTLYR
jgi:hypothetical protein